MEKRNITKWIYWFTFSVAVIAVYKTLDNFSDIMNWIGSLIGVLMPFILAIIIAYLFYIPARKLEGIYRKIGISPKKARVLSVFSVYIVAILLIVIMINCVFPPIIESVKELINALPGYYNQAVDFVENAEDDTILSKIDIETIINKLKEFDFASLINTDNISQYINGVIGVANAIFGLFVMIVVSIYLLLERGEIREFFGRLSGAIFKKNVQKSIGEYVEKTNEIFINFIYCQIIDGIIIGIITSIAMSIIGVKYAVLLGFLIGLFNIIPYFGAIIAVAITVLITIFTGGINQAILVAIILIILQQIDSNIINPKIIGEGLKVSPILIIFAVTVGGHYFDVLGMFLAVPVVAIIKILINDYIEIKKVQRIKEENSKTY